MTNTKSFAAAAAASMPDVDADGELGPLIEFRAGVAGSFRRWPDTLVEMVDAMVCSGRPIASPAWLTLEPECRRGYGSVYQALETDGAIDADALTDGLVAAAAGRGQRSWWAVDVTPWKRPEAHMSADRSMVYTSGDADRVAAPGWPMLVTAHVGSERSAQVLGVDAELLSPERNTNEVAAGQIRRVVDSLERTGSRAGEVPLFLLDAGFCPIYLTQQVTCQAQILVRLRSDRVFYRRADPKPAHRRGPQAMHGRRFKLSDETSWGTPDEAVQSTLHAGTAEEIRVTARIWHQLHPAARQRRKWDASEGVVEGSIIHRQATWTRTGHTQDWWLWWAGPAGSYHAEVVTRAYLHRFSIEHGFKFAKHLGWTNYKPINPATAANWTWLILAAMCQFRARPRTRRRLPAALGPARPTNPSQGPPSIPTHLGTATPTGECAKKLPPRPRAPHRSTEPEPATIPASDQKRQNTQYRTPQRTTTSPSTRVRHHRTLKLQQ